LENLLTQLPQRQNGKSLAEITLRNQELEKTIAELKVKLEASLPSSELELPVFAEVSVPGHVHPGEIGISQGTIVSRDSCQATERVVSRDIYQPDPITEDISGLYWTQADSSTSVSNHHSPPRSLLRSIPTIPTSFVNQPSTKYWEIPVLLLPPEHILDRFLGTIIEERMADRDNLTLSKVKTLPSLTAFFFPNSVLNDKISSLVVEMIFAAGMTRLPEMIAMFHNVHIVLQWAVRPCPETYQKIPAWLTPRPSQLTIPHPHWVTHLAFPLLRDRVIDHQDVYCTDLFTSLFPKSLDVNWPFDVSDTVTYTDGKVTMTEAFEKHISNLDNWSVTEPFSTMFPELHYACNYKSRRENFHKY
jgi:hypothetical protein